MPARSVVAGVLVGVVLAGLVVLSGWLDRPTPERGEQAVVSFLAAWRAHREGTYVVDATFERTTADGRRLESAVHVAQRPPERVLVQFGAVDATLGDRSLGCLEQEEADGATQLYCTAGEAAAYQEVVVEELELWVRYFLGEPPLYEVTGDGDGCFDLEAVRDLPVLPYGEQARFCFDDRTGAMLLARLERPEATDVTRAVSVRGEVRDADLRLPDGSEPD